MARERCATDRRQVFCRITSGGLTLLAKLDEPLTFAGERALRRVTRKEIRQLLELLDRTREGLNEQLETLRR